MLTRFLRDLSVMAAVIDFYFLSNQNHSCTASGKQYHGACIVAVGWGMATSSLPRPICPDLVLTYRSEFWGDGFLPLGVMG